jgi:alkylation response protein AidB-like acyl-CoA dehydrogenase
MVHHVGIQNHIGERFMELEGVEAQLNLVAKEYSEGVDYGMAFEIYCHEGPGEGSQLVDKALDIAGGFGIFHASGLERMMRDVRLGRIHPTNTYLSRELHGKASLGVDFDIQPRWR